MEKGIEKKKELSAKQTHIIWWITMWIVKNTLILNVVAVKFKHV